MTLETIVPSPTLTAVINLDLPGARISRHVYGHFAEHLGRCIYGGFWVGEDSDIPNERGIRLDVVEALRAIRIPNLRWPGGCFADDYHWRDGIGPREARPSVVNSHWGDVVEDNSFGTHEFMDLCEMLGADPYICGNVGSGTVQEMSDWVQYLTRADGSPMAALRRANGRDQPWKVPFWGIGNESWGCGGNMRAEAYADLARQYSAYLRDQADNHLFRIAVGAPDDDYAWTDAVMRSLSNVGPGCPRQVVQAISFHYYTVPGSVADRGTATEFDDLHYYRTVMQAHRVGEMIQRHDAVMSVYDPAKTIGLVMDEWGTWFDVEPGTEPGFLFQQNTMRDALVASLHFDAFHRHADRLRMANVAQTINVLQAMILTDPDSGAMARTPTYHVFEMNTAHHDADSLRVDLLGEIPVRDVDGIELPLVSSSASVRKGTAMVSLTNLDAERGRTVVLDLRGRSIRGAVGRLLTAATLHAHNTPGQPEEVHPVPLEDVRPHPRGLQIELPAHSYVTVSLELDEIDKRA